VGKSSITNALVPNANAQIGALSDAADKGKHTTTASHWFAMTGGGGLIDSPGIREFGVNHLDRIAIENGFIECKTYLHQCQFRDCNHLNSKGCGIIAAYERGEINPYRFASFQALLNEVDNQ